MRSIGLLLLALLALSTHAQSPREAGNPVGGAQDQRSGSTTIEGFWQDTARRVLFMRDASPSSVYGKWNSLDPQQTYPLAKQIRRSGATYELVDLNYDDEYVIRILNAKADGIEFVRSSTWSGCGMRHTCQLNAAELFCSLENICPENGRDVLDWRGEERYARRDNCERVGRREAQGIPVRCR